MKTKSTSSALSLTVTALLAALLCVIAPISIPIGPVPVSLSIFAVCLAAALGGTVRGVAAVGIYVLLGTLGLPVFSGFSGGAGHLLGVTGGFVFGYIPCALVVGLFVRRGGSSVWRTACGMALGVLCCYAVGTAWFAIMTGSGVLKALSVCVLPFLLWDALKIAAAAAICPRLRKALERIPGRG